ncbi:S41 family peptidase [Dyella sp.]|jgi:C-terminal processing protease CtpA/Prc|uniref:S41 family peptidase n=1 Tax=Dyella sp. TaxID=1869338 RepID=UPI002D79A23C|nr:S41 family peptidase [Dyella sp.]HET6431943.1 S41 family peptidase [Dyella sp.]
MQGRWLIGGFMLMGLVGGVRAQEAAETPAQRYAHVQDLNNGAYRLLHPQQERAPSSDDARKALRLVLQSQDALDALEAGLQDDAELLDRAEERRFDAVRRQAAAEVLLGDHAAALDALERLRGRRLYADYADFLLKDPALKLLQGERRFQTLIADLRRIDRRWKAAALMPLPASGLTEAQRVAGLSLFWSEARYNFVYFDQVPELDWSQAYLDFLPRVIAARTLHDYYDVMMRFAPLLHDGHTDIDPPDAIADEFLAQPPIRTTLLDGGQVAVTWVGSPAMEAKGIRVGDELLEVDGQPVRQYARQHVAPYVSSSTSQDRHVRMYDYQLLDGDHREPVRLEMRHGDGTTYAVDLSREPDAAVRIRPKVEWRMLPGGIAYLAVNEFEDDAGPRAFAEHLPRILASKGLILDVRHNGGGSASYGLDILSYLSDQPIQEEARRSLEYVPVFRAWNGSYVAWRTLASRPFEKPHEAHFRGPVAVLAGPRTFSAGEDFVVSFKLMKRGLLIGETTGGSTGQPLQFELPGGGHARICAKRDTWPDGTEFVGQGIVPNLRVAPTIGDIRAGRDPVVERAAAVLRAHVGR